MAYGWRRWFWTMETFTCGAMLLLAGGLPVGFVHADDLSSVDVQLALDGAVFAGTNQVEGGPALLLDVNRTEGRWERIWGEAPRLGKCVAEGIVTESTVSNEAINLSLLVAVSSDPWVKGGRAGYQVTLNRTGPGAFVGCYTGTFRGVSVTGWARAAVTPAAPMVGKPFELGEHPRLLFRKTDLPALKAKAETPFGQAALAQMDGVIGSALKYQLTGDKKYATDIIPEVEKRIADTGIGDKIVRGRVLGWRFEQIALAYDLCYDAWPADSRRKVENLVTGPQGWRAFNKTWTFQQEVSWEPTGYYPGPIRYGPALAALAIYGEKGPPPGKPGEPFAVCQPDGKLVAATDYKPASGVPVMKFESGKMPGEWLALAGVAADAVREPAKARPELGEFRLLEHNKDGDYYEGKISITVAAKRKYHTTAFFYTVIDNDAPRWAQFNSGHGGVVCYVNGTRLADGDLVRLEKGLYPLMAVAPVGETSSWGQEFCNPTFTELTEPEALAKLAALKADYAAAVKQWEFDVDQHNRLGGADIGGLRIFEVSRRAMRQYYREAMGRGGYMGAHLVSLEGPNRYAVAYRNAFGADLSGRQEAADFLARKMFMLAYGATGIVYGAEMDDTTGFAQPYSYEPTYDLAANHFAMLYPITREQWKPAVLWAWQRHTGWTGPVDATNAFKEASRTTEGYPHAAHVAWTFVNLPLDAKPKPPAGQLPLSWRADDYGWYGFRNAYQDENDFVAQIYLRRGPGGSQNAGAFRVTGLGQRWAPGGAMMRLFENVVQLPDDEINATGPGELLYHAVQPDGSGVVTLDLRDVYAAPSPNLLERQGFLRIPGNFKQSGITGRRSFAVDYSGKSGVPCLLAIVDKVQGARSSVWSWPLEFGTETFTGATTLTNLVSKDKPKKSYTQQELKQIAELLKKPAAPKAAAKADPKQTDKPGEPDANATKARLPVIDGNRFTVSKGQAQLRGTLVVPDKVNFGIEELEQFQMGAKFVLLRFHSTGAVARGTGEYMAIITIGSGEPPAVKTSGRGLNSVITVGERKIRFDGEKIVLE
jgi:hypothetical protein